MTCRKDLVGAGTKCRDVARKLCARWSCGTWGNVYLSKPDELASRRLQHFRALPCIPCWALLSHDEATCTRLRRGYLFRSAKPALASLMVALQKCSSALDGPCSRSLILIFESCHCHFCCRSVFVVQWVQICEKVFFLFLKNEIFPFTTWRCPKWHCFSFSWFHIGAHAVFVVFGHHA